MAERIQLSPATAQEFAAAGTPLQGAPKQGFNLKGFLGQNAMPLMMAAAMAQAKPKKGEEMNLLMPLMFMHLMGGQGEGSNPQMEGPEDPSKTMAPGGQDPMEYHREFLKRFQGMTLGPGAPQQSQSPRTYGPPAPTYGPPAPY